MLPHEQSQSGALNVSHLQNSALNLVQIVCGIVCRPLELILRPFHGTRFHPIPIVAGSSLMMLLLPAISAIVTAAINLIPFAHASPSVGMFDIGDFAELYFILSAVHGVRLYRRMLHMHTEEHSGYEGKPLPFFPALPWGKSFWVTRIVLEPGFVLIVSTSLKDVFLIQPGLATFLRVAALALFMKNFVSWYRSWECVRNLLDTRNAAPILAQLIEGKASDDDLASINLASFPKGLSPEVRTQAARIVARAYTPE